ncbi:hypothetical protein [Pseudomonas phage vB_PsaM_M1]|nr:hypothetical protein [Pseudomonas phage vB_PsaM_M1]
MNIPDGYRFLLIDNSLVKLFRSYDGGFAIAEQWALNSGCTEIVPVEYNCYRVHGYSGSMYTIRNEQGSLNSYTRMMYDRILRNSTDSVPIKEISLQEAIDILEENK